MDEARSCSDNNCPMSASKTERSFVLTPRRSPRLAPGTVAENLFLPLDEESRRLREQENLAAYARTRTEITALPDLFPDLVTGSEEGRRHSPPSIGLAFRQERQQALQQEEENPHLPVGFVEHRIRRPDLCLRPKPCKRYKVGSGDLSFSVGVDGVG